MYSPPRVEEEWDWTDCVMFWHVPANAVVMFAYFIAQMSHLVRMCPYNNIQMSLVVKCVRLLASVQKSISLQRSKNESLSITFELEVDWATRPTYFWARFSSVHCTCQSRTVILGTAPSTSLCLPVQAPDRGCFCTMLPVPSPCCHWRQVDKICFGPIPRT